MRQVGTIGIANKINLNRRLYTMESLDSLREQIEGNRTIYSDQETQAPIGRVEKSFLGRQRTESFGRFAAG